MAFSICSDTLGRPRRFPCALARLSPARLPASWADALLEPSPRKLGLVAEPVRQPDRIVALADYTVSADEEVAEVGLVVDDAWQHNGLGRTIFNRLLALGESRGIRLFVAYVHWNNLRVIRALDRIATVIDRVVEAPVLKFTFTRRLEVGEVHGVR